MEGLRRVEAMAGVTFLEMTPGTVSIGCRTVETRLGWVWNTLMLGCSTGITLLSNSLITNTCFIYFSY